MDEIDRGEWNEDDLTGDDCEICGQPIWVDGACDPQCPNDGVIREPDDD